MIAKTSTPWPAKIADAAFHGLAGEFVELVKPHSEADPVALLIQFLVASGAYLGRNAFTVAEAARHHPNLFAAIVGNSSKARKGSSWSWVRQLLLKVDEAWTNTKVCSGLVSGEGLIFHVRDPIIKQTPNGDATVIDDGVEDKRLLSVEEEFSAVLKAAGRDKATLSDVMRKAWDGNQTLRTLAKNSPVTATGSHIAVIGHITTMELQSLLANVDCVNGFGNRFLWCLVQRSQLLPHGGNIAINQLRPIADKLSKIGNTFDFLPCQIHRTKAADIAWETLYHELAEVKPGLLGPITARSEAQVLRLSLLYALLDDCRVIDEEHLAAAKAVWDYCDQSAAIIFGHSTGNQLADKILGILTDQGAPGISRTELSARLGRNKLKADIDAAVDLLIECQRVESFTVPTDGRPEHRLRLIDA